MTRNGLIGLAIASTLTALGALAPPPAALAQQSEPPPATKGAPGGMHAYGWQMMTPAERTEWQQKMAAAKTPEERARLRDEHHAQMVQRADEQGLTLMGRGGAPQIYGQQLMTPAERNAFMEKMHAAASRDERIRLRDEHRAEMQRRAKEKGITLPLPRADLQGMGGMGGKGGPGMGGMGERGMGHEGTVRPGPGSATPAAPSSGTSALKP